MSSGHINREEAAEIFIAHIGLVRMVAYRAAPSGHLVDDIVHNTFLTFVTKAEQWTYDPLTIKQLLRSITEKMAAREWATYLKHLPDRVQELANEIRRRGNESSEFVSAWNNLEEKTDALQKCLDKLTPGNRTLIEDFYVNGRTGEELAEKMNISRKALYHLVGRIRIALHDCIVKTLNVEIEHV